MFDITSGVGVNLLTVHRFFQILVLAVLAGAATWLLIYLHKKARYERRRLELALVGNKLGVWNWSFKKGFAINDRRYAEMLGYGTDGAAGLFRLASDHVHPEDRPRMRADLDRYLADASEHAETEFRLRDASGNWRWVLARGVTVSRDRRGRPTLVIGITVDITEQKRVQQRLWELSYTDPVTGLHNRAYFDEKLKELDREDALPLSVIMGDLNSLKYTNDAYGHYTGDSLLVSAANIIRDSCRSTDIVTRWGGDEFAILLPNTTQSEALLICRRIRAACAKAGLRPVELSVSLGVATRDSMNQPLEEVVKSAEDWMYRHKVQERRGTQKRWAGLAKRSANLK